MKIGVFDSGVGGLSVLKSLIDARLFSEIIYYGDTARVPYGNKDKATIVRFSLEAVDFFIPHKIDMLIVACNTASAYALKDMQKIAPFPVIGVVESGVLSLSNKIKNKKDSILIIATKATIKSGIYERKLRKLGYENITSLQTGLFVPLVEEGVFEGELLEATFRHYFGGLFGGLNSSLGTPCGDLGNFERCADFSPVLHSKFPKNSATSTANTRICDLDSADSQNLVKIQSRVAQPLKASSGVGEGVVREGEGSDFAIQAPAPSLKENARGQTWELNADLSAQGREENRDSSPTAQNDNLMKIAESSVDSVDSAILSQSGLPRSHSLAHNDEFNGLPREQSSLAMTENKDFAESLQNTQISKSPQDESTLDSAPSTQKANSSIVDEKLGLRSHERGNRTNGSLTKRVASLPDLSPQDEFALDSANCKNGDITGFWLSPRDKVSARTSIIKIFKKDGKYFAYNVAFLDELPPKKDALNQNFALRDREILGSVYAYNLERSGEASYINGRYYDFNKGKIFHLKAKLDCNKLILLISADNVGFLGKKKVYSAITKSEAEFYIKEHPIIDFSGVK